ncbi:PAPA-1-like conserved region-domain-containing protein [Umbelopsis sp. AD052]|nr:PAPA-1-like conserved region-domain-containing protein [Umbelopsis sp. AD052]
MSETEVVPNRPLTKRQRAKLNDGAEEDYLELPMDSGKKKHLTVEEQALRRSEVARRRKNQSIQRAEKDKADTINRLLKKQASKSKKAIKDDGGDGTDSAIGENGRPQPRIPEVPTQIRYVSNKAGSSLSIPSTMDLNDLIASSKKVDLKKAISCAVKGCGKPKKYLTSKSRKPVCSLDHYHTIEG